MATEIEYSLDELAEVLALIFQDRLSSQIEMSEGTGVDQSTVSKAKNNNLKRLSQKTDKLMRYSEAILRQPRTNNVTNHLLNIFYSNGGTLEELNAIIEHGADLISRKLATKNSIKQVDRQHPHSKSGPHVIS